jgi:hypothetical protein
MCNAAQKVTYFAISIVIDQMSDLCFNCFTLLVLWRSWSSSIDLHEYEALICFFQMNNVNERPKIWMVTSNAALTCLEPTLHGIVRTWKIVDNTVMNIPCVWRKEGSTSIALSHGPTDVNVLKIVQN